MIDILLYGYDKFNERGDKEINRNTKGRCEMCSKLTIKAPEQRQ